MTFFLPKIPKAVLLIAIGMLLYQASGETKVNGYLIKNDNYYFSYPGTTFYHGETITRWSGGQASIYPKAPVDVAAGNAKIDNIQRRNSQMRFTAHASQSATLVVNTLFYPGWIAKVNEKPVPIQFQDSNHRGLITIQISPGYSQILVSFTETKLRKLADLLSLIVGFMAITMLIIMKDKKPVSST